MTEATVAALAAMLGGTVRGDESRVIRGLCDLRAGAPDRLGFVRHPKYAPLAQTTAAGAVLATGELATPAALIVVPDVHVAYAKTASFFHPPPRATRHAVHPTAVVHPEAVLEEPVEIGPYVTLGRCKVGAGTVIGAHTHVGDGSSIGRDCTIYQGVMIHHGCRIGDRVILHSACVLGGDGFGFARDTECWVKIPQLGGVVIGDDVELQSFVNVDRGALSDTIIGRGTKLDTRCHVAHNAVIGEHVVIAGGGCIAGSAKVGDRCVFGGLVGISGHIEIAPDVRIGGGSTVFKDIREPGEYAGTPTLSLRDHVRLTRKLREMGRADSE
ncbi:MAG: hypothetical protein RL398_2812 [Planctomycetota bacterium]|jgi:UDP-3-O-[3-hydroxymyristoyl] glucosamine N-acyltransferase